MLDLTVTQLKRAAAIKEQIDGLNKELHAILGGSATSATAPKKKRSMSASAKRKIAVAQKARWAKIQRNKPAKPPVKAAAKAKKKKMSPAARAKVSAKLKAYWAAKKSDKK